MEQIKTPSRRRTYTKNTPIRLPVDERNLIEKILAEENPPFYRRLTTKLRRKFHTLLLFDEGKDAAFIASAIGVTLVTVHSYAQTYVEGGLWKLAAEYPALVEAREKRENKLKEVNPLKFHKEQAELEIKRKQVEQLQESKEKEGKPSDRKIELPAPPKAQPQESISKPKRETAILLSEQERSFLLELSSQAASSNTGELQKKRAEALLLKEKGQSHEQICSWLDISFPKLSLWLESYASKGLLPLVGWQESILLRLQEGEKKGISRLLSGPRMPWRKRMLLETLLAFDEGKTAKEVAAKLSLPLPVIYKYGKAYMQGKLIEIFHGAGLDTSLPKVNQLTITPPQRKVKGPAKAVGRPRKEKPESGSAPFLAKSDICFLLHLQEQEEGELSLWAKTLLALDEGKDPIQVAQLLDIPESQVKHFESSYKKAGIEKEKDFFAPAISLSRADKASLEAAYKKPSSGKRRAVLIKGLLLLDEGGSIDEVAALLKVTRSRVLQWISKYEKEGLAFLNAAISLKRKRKRIPVR